MEIKTHMLIAGESNSGKSVTMNGLIIEVLLENPENEIYLFDLKLVEFNRYRHIAPIYTNIREMADKLEELHMIMMQRYQIMANSDEIEWQAGHIYIFIDELADITSHENKVLSKEIQNRLSSIARMGRAAGVHLVMATQYPTKQVIPMQIKMNTQKICLKCNSDIGYRVMLDRKYCDLKGNGDALYQDHKGDITHFQVNYYSNEVVKEFINECRKYYEYKGDR